MNRTYILISGSRFLGGRKKNRPSSIVYKFLTDLMDIFGVGLTIIHGDCPKGIDNLVKNACDDLNIDQIKYPINWGKYNKKAGWIRNNLMFDHGCPDYVICIFNDLNNKSPGTSMMEKICRHFDYLFVCDMKMLDSDNYSDTMDMFRAIV